MYTEDPEIKDFIATITAWHKARVEQLELVKNNRTADIQLGEHKIEAGSDMAKGIRLGIIIALEQLGTLPFTVTPVAGDESDSEEEEA